MPYSWSFHLESGKRVVALKIHVCSMTERIVNPMFYLTRKGGIGGCRREGVSKLLILCLVICVLLLPGEAVPAEKPTIYFGINLRYNPMILYKRYQPLMDYLTSQTPYRFELKISRDYREAVKNLKEGKTQISSLGDGAFVEAVLLHGAIPIVKPLSSEGKPYYRCAIIVPYASELRGLADLQGKRVAFGSHHSTTGNLIPRAMLAAEGITSRDVRSASLKNHDAVTKAVLKGQFDAGAVKEMFAKKYGGHGLRILAYSDPIATVPLVVRRGTPDEVIKAVTGALLRLNPRDPAHRKLTEQWDDEFRYGFVPATAADYQDELSLFRKKPYGCGTGCHQ